MQHITGIPRNQMCFSSLEDTTSPNNPIRFIDGFSETMALNLWSFELQVIKAECKRSPKVLQKQYAIKKEALQPLISPKLQSR